MYRKRHTSFFLSILLILSLLIQPFAGFAASTDHWASDLMERWRFQGLLSGDPDGRLRPEEAITRAEFFTLLDQALGLGLSVDTSFSDVGPTDWFAGVVGRAVSAGYTAGYPDGTFRPKRPITREEAAVVLAKAFDLPLDDAGADGFTDRDRLSTWALPYVGALRTSGAIEGYPDGRFGPEAPLKRGEAVAMVAGISGTVYNHPSTYTGVVPGSALVSTDGVTLKNMTIPGDLYLTEGIGEGDVILDGVTVEGTTYVRAGGSHSVHLIDTLLGEVKVAKRFSDVPVRIVAEGRSRVKGTLVIESPADLEVMAKADDRVVFDHIVISDRFPEEGLIRLSGNFETVTLRAQNADFTLAGGRIGNLLVEAPAEVTIAGEASVSSLTAMTGDVLVNGREIPEGETTVAETGSAIPTTGGGSSSKRSDREEEDPASPEEPQEEVFVPGNSGDAVTDLTFVEKGTTIDGHRLGFYPPASFDTPPATFDSWLLMYSTKPFDEVLDHLQRLTREEILELSDTAGANRLYRITTYDWADGLGNTMRAGQRDVVTGEGFLPGLYSFYVATYTDDGVVGLAEAPEQIDMLPAPYDLVLRGEGSEIADYSVDFASYADDRIEKNLFFYSDEGLYATEERLQALDRAEIEALAAGNRALLTTETSGPLAFNEGQLTLTGEPLASGIYYVYGATVGADGVLAHSVAREMIVTAPVPEDPETTIGDGVGTVLPAGGATSSSDPEAEPFYAYIREAAGGGTPRIALFSSSRDAFETVYNHYYFDDPTYGSLEDNFRDLGFEPVFIPLSIDNRHFVANHPYFAGLVASCDAAFLMGGDQNKHVRALLEDDGSDSLVMGALRQIVDRGGIVAGTSAGMAAMGTHSFGYGTPAVALLTNETEHYEVSDIPTAGDLFPAVDNNNLTVPGIGLVPDEMLNDTHFDARGRLGRLIVALRDTGKSLGVGADEGTGLAISGGVGEVVGLHGIYLVDAGDAVYSEAGPDASFNVENLRVHYLTAGDRYDFATGEVTPAADKSPAIEGAETPEPVADLFAGDYATTKVLLDLALSEDELLSANSGPFEILLKKDGDTSAYRTEATYGDPALAGYEQMTLVGYRMDVTFVPVPKIAGLTVYSYPDTLWISYALARTELDLDTINEDTIRLIPVDDKALYEDMPAHDGAYNETEVRATSDFLPGDQIWIAGIRDQKGVAVTPQVWKATAADEEGTTLWAYEATLSRVTEVQSYEKAYNTWIAIEEGDHPLDLTTVTGETVRLISDVSTLYEPPITSDYDDYGEIGVSIEQDAFAAGDLIRIEGVKDTAGYLLEPQTWVFDGESWSLRGADNESPEADTTAPEIQGVLRSDTYADTAYLLYEETGSGVDPASVSTDTIAVATSGGAIAIGELALRPEDGEIMVWLSEAFTTGATITIDGLTDLAGNRTPRQTWTYDGEAFVSRDLTAPLISALEPSTTHDDTVYLVFIEEESGLDEATVTDGVISVHSTTGASVEILEMDVRPSEGEIMLYIDRPFEAGDELRVDGLSDLAGNRSEGRSWVFDGETWTEV